MENLLLLATRHAWLIPALPFLAFVLISLLTLRLRKLSAAISIGAMLASAVIALLVFLAVALHGKQYAGEYSLSLIGLGTVEIHLGVILDSLSGFMVLVVALVASLIQIYSLGYMEEEGDASLSRYYAYMSLFTFAMLGLVLSNNLVQTYVCWELVGLGSYLLIGFWYQKKSAADAAKKAFVVTRFGDLGLLAGIVILATIAGSFDFTKLSALMPALVQAHGQALIALVAVLIFCGAVGKSAQFPLHVWLPDAMEGPTPVSALIHSATMVAAGVYLVARAYPIFVAAPFAMLVVAYIGAITALMAALIAVAQNDIKRILAYSTISQLGYMMLALGVGGYAAGTMHLMTHALFKPLLFLCAGAVIHALHTNDIWKMGGLGKTMRITGITCLVGCLAISGIPPFSGFFSKDAILEAVSGQLSSHFLLPIIGFAVVFLTAFYMFRLYFVTFCGTFRGEHQPHEMRPVMTVPLIVLAALSCVSGFVGVPGHNWWEKFMAWGAEATHAAQQSLNLGPTGLSLLLALAGILTAYVIYQKQTVTETSLRTRFSAIYSLLDHKFWFDEIYLYILHHTVFLGAAVCAWVDSYIIDGGVRSLGWVTAWAGTLLSEEHTGKVQYYALMFLVAVVFLLLCAWVLAGIPITRAATGLGALLQGVF